MVDMHLMGHLDSELFMGAVALGGVIFNLVYWGFAFLKMSLGGITAQAFGANDQEGQSNALFRGLLIAIIGSIFLLTAQTGIEKISFKILDGSPEVKALASNYFYVRIWAAPAAIILMVLYGWFIGMQNALYPMLIAVSVNIVNIAVSFFMVKEMGMKEEGVAWGSVISQYFGLAVALFLLSKKYTHHLKTYCLTKILQREGFRQFTHVSGNLFFRTLCVIAVFTFFTSKSAGMGDAILAINSALLQLFFLFSYFLDGFANAAEALVGKFIGARDKINFKKSILLLFLWGGSFGILFTLLYYFKGHWLVSFFTNQTNLLSMASNYLIWVALIPLVSFASFIWDGIYIGATASRAMLITMFASMALFFFLPYYLLVGCLGNLAIWIAMLLFLASRSLLQTALFAWVLKHNPKTRFLNTSNPPI